MGWDLYNNKVKRFKAEEAFNKMKQAIKLNAFSLFLDITMSCPWRSKMLT